MGKGIRRLGCLLLVVLMMAPLGQAGDPLLRLEVDVGGLSVNAPLELESHKALWRAELPASRFEEDPAAVFAPGTVTAIQYWRNSTLLVEPNTGAVIHRHADSPQERPVPFSPEKLFLTWARDGADIRVLVDSPALAYVEAKPGAEISASPPTQELVDPRALDYIPLLGAFSGRPARSGWSTLQIDCLSGPGEVRILIDGWDLRLAVPDEEAEIHTGIETSFTTPGVVREIYSVLVITVEGARVTFPQAKASWEGYVSQPNLRWNGPAQIERATGILTLNGVTSLVEEERLHLDGEFQGNLAFTDGTTSTTGHLRVSGRGTSSVQVNLATTGGLGLSPEVSLGVPLLFTFLGLALVALRGRQKTGSHARLPWRGAPPAAAPAPPPPSAPATPPAIPSPAATTPPAPADPLEHALLKVRSEPLNGEARFGLGVLLLRHNQPGEAARHLERAFRLSPESLLKFLEEPTFADLRQGSEVRAVLARFHREHQYKIWAGYA